MSETLTTPNTPLLNTSRPGRWHYLLVFVILLSAAWLRFDNITTVGVRYEDDAWYVSDAQLWHRCAKVLMDGPAWSALLNHDKAAYQQRMDDIGIDFSWHYRKPSQGYTMSAAAVMFLVGDGPNALLLLNAFLGTLTVLLVYGLCRTLFSPRIALLASLLLAVSPYHLNYCRSALSHTSAGYFALLGMYCWALGKSRLWSTRRTFLLSGLACGFATTCHYSVAYFAGIPLLMELIAPNRRTDSLTTTKRIDYRHWLRSTAWMCLGFAIPFLAIESVFTSARIAATITNSYLPLYSFSHLLVRHAQLLLRGGTVGGDLIHLDVGWSMIQYFTHWHGWLALVLAATGTGLVIRKRNASSIVAWIVLSSSGVLILQAHPIARGLNSCLPFIAICVAVAVDQLIKIWPKKPKLAYASMTMLMCVVLTPAIGQSMELKSKHSGLAQACQYINTVPAGKVVIPSFRRYGIHLEHSTHEMVQAELWTRTHTPEQTIQRWLDEGIRLVTVDPQFWHECPSNADLTWWLAVDALLKQKFAMAAEYTHMDNFRWEFLAEGTWGQFRLDHMNKAEGGTIRIYDLQAAPSPQSSPQMVGTSHAKKSRG